MFSYKIYSNNQNNFYSVLKEGFRPPRDSIRFKDGLFWIATTQNYLTTTYNTVATA